MEEVEKVLSENGYQCGRQVSGALEGDPDTGVAKYQHQYALVDVMVPMNNSLPKVSLFKWVDATATPWRYTLEYVMIENGHLINDIEKALSALREALKPRIGDTQKFVLVAMNRNTGRWYKGKSLGEVIKGTDTKKGHEVLVMLYHCEPEEVSIYDNGMPALCDPQPQGPRTLGTTEEAMSEFPKPSEYDGLTCPQCGGEHTMEGQGLSPEDNCHSVTYDMTCRRCGASWTEEYELVGYRSLTDEEGVSSDVPKGMNRLEELEWYVKLTGEYDTPEKLWEFVKNNRGKVHRE